MIARSRERRRPHQNCGGASRPAQPTPTSMLVTRYPYHSLARQRVAERPACWVPAAAVPSAALRCRVNHPQGIASIGM